MSIVVSGLSKAYGSERVLDGLDLAVEKNSFTVLCGPSGSGKSVLFRLLVGLEQPDSGTIMLNGKDITDMSAARRAVGYVPQSFALYPHLSVHDNIGYPLKLAKWPISEISRRVAWASDVLAITHLLDKTPDQLSGGEKQRTALARGLLKDADIFILDDPLVGLDYKLRERLMDELKGLQKELDATFVYATSDSLEALTMAENMVVLDSGRIVQQGSVFDVYRAPGHVRAMEIVGFPRANVLRVTHDDGITRAGPFMIRDLPENAGMIGIRPESLKPGQDGEITTDAEVRLVEDLGGEHVIYTQAGEHPLTMAVAAGDQFPVQEGDVLRLRVSRDAVVAFSGDDGRALVASKAGQ